MYNQWFDDRIKVLCSRPLLEVLGCIEIFETEEKEKGPYLESMSKREGTKGGTVKNQYQVHKELGRHYPQVLRNISDLEKGGIISRGERKGRGKRRQIVLAWTYKGAVLFPEYAPVDALAGVYSRFFGGWSECASYFSKVIGCERGVADTLMEYLCWFSKDFLRWVRDDIILSQRLRGKNDSYWRQLVIVYLVKEDLLDNFFSSLMKNFEEIITEIIPEGGSSKSEALISEVFGKLDLKTVSTIQQIL